MKKIKISLDARGGDYAPEIVVEGAAEAKVRYPDVDFIFFGNEEVLITALLFWTSSMFFSASAFINRLAAFMLAMLFKIVKILKN